VFKQQTGATLTEFRSQQRLERFFKLYNSPANPTMLSAALDAGFGSYLQFYRVFREAMGCGPAEYRRRGDESNTTPSF
jgi:methylphosphotriester-DNA--protein-cysteine methyltransferase